MYGKVRFSVFPGETEYRKFSLSSLKSNPYMQLDFNWVTAPALLGIHP
jgi:hypothetical protein